MDTLDKISEIYIDALSEVITKVTGISFNVSSRQSENSFDEITGAMYLNGKKNGMLFVTAKEPDVRVICSSMIGVPPSDVSKDEIDDTMCELVNMTAGSAKLRLGNTDYMFSLLQPFVIKGRYVSIVTKSITRVESGVLTNGEITVRIKLIY